jgi:hypothetical protein
LVLTQPSLALVETRLIVAAVVRKFDIAPAWGTTEASMQPMDVEMLHPATDECRLRFTLRGVPGERDKA